MDALSHLRSLIAALDEALVDAFCVRARLPWSMRLYAPSTAPRAGLDELAGQFADAPTLAARVQALHPTYVRLLLPALCAPGTDEGQTSCLAADATCLDALARRLALAVHVATRKREALPAALQAALLTHDPVRVEDAITNSAVETEVLARVRSRARTGAVRHETPDQIAGLYEKWIIPLSRKIQVHGLLAAP